MHRSAGLATVVAVVVLLTACAPGYTAPDEVADGVPVHVVSMTEFAFTPDTLVVEAGSRVTLRLVNEGTIEHDLDHTFVDPGETADLTIPIPEGTHEMICTIPGHLEAGMSLTVIAR